MAGPDFVSIAVLDDRMAGWRTGTSRPPLKRDTQKISVTNSGATHDSYLNYQNYKIVDSFPFTARALLLYPQRLVMPISINFGIFQKLQRSLLYLLAVFVFLGARLSDLWLVID